MRFAALSRIARAWSERWRLAWTGRGLHRHIRTFVQHNINTSLTASGTWPVVAMARSEMRVRGYISTAFAARGPSPCPSRRWRELLAPGWTNSVGDTIGVATPNQAGGNLAAGAHDAGPAGDALPRPRHVLPTCWPHWSRVAISIALLGLSGCPLRRARRAIWRQKIATCYTASAETEST